MKRERVRLTSAILFLLVALSGAGAAQADFAAGVAAHRRGDFETALREFRALAEQGDARAQSRLGYMYYTGEGVERDLREAVHWVRMAAHQGDPHAQFNLADAFRQGQGVPEDPAMAYVWYSLAARNAPQNAGNLREEAETHRQEVLGILGPRQYNFAQRKLHQMEGAVPDAPPFATAGITPDRDPPPLPPKSAPIADSRRPAKGTLSQPRIDTPTTIQANMAAVEIAGQVTGSGKIRALSVDGSPAPIREDGRFKFNRAVSIGDSDIQLVATDEWGQTARAAVHVTRSVDTAAATAFPRLDPTRVKGERQRQAVALIIGVETYENAPAAEFAENDARVFYDYAVNALGVPAQRVRILIGGNARRLDIEKALKNWLPAEATKDSDVFVFFSGHGLAAEDGDLFLLPYDGDRSLLADSALRRSRLIEAFSATGAKSLTLFLDTCFSGGTRGNDTLLVSARPVMVAGRDGDLPANVTVLGAAANDQLSSSLAQTRHGLFSYFLMRGMEGEADTNGDRKITAGEMRDYLAEHVPPEANRIGRHQIPQLLGDPDKVLVRW